jgi:hypothetical protein
MEQKYSRNLNPVGGSVTGEPEIFGKMNARDLVAISQLLTSHITQYGRFDLDLNTRIAFCDQIASQPSRGSLHECWYWADMASITIVSNAVFIGCYIYCLQCWH